MKLLVFFRLAEVNQQELGLDPDWELLSFDGDRCEVGGLAPRVFLRLVEVVDGLCFDLEIHHFPDSGRLDPPEELAFLLSAFLVACIMDNLLMNSISLTVVPIFPASLDST